MMSVRAREDRALRPVAYAGNFDGAVLAQKFGRGATVAALDFFRLGNGCTQTHRQIVREMVAANGYSAGVAYDSATVNNQFGRAAANVQQAAAQVPFILR